LFGWHRRATNIRPEQKLQILTSFNEHIGSGSAALDVIRGISRRTRIDAYQIKTLLYQFVWSRKLRIDLYRPLLMNKPLLGEVIDPISAYDDWFRR
ncbi:MAG: hypothetical protein KDA57_20275, partial [Planctomycetales bacterium]|nr:hypothetical protein [Planctomycetales bacterium]